MHVYVATLTTPPSFHCYISSLISQQDCSYKVSCVKSSKLLFHHVLMVFLFEKSQKSVQNYQTYKAFTEHIIIRHNCIAYVFFKIQKITTHDFHLFFK